MTNDNRPIWEQESSEAAPTLGMNPKKFSMWLFLLSVVMIFASLTSGYIVRKAEGNWVDFELPPIFWFTTAILLLSSVTHHLAFQNAKRDNLVAVKGWMVLTALLGIAFLVTQWYSWVYLVNINVYFSGNNVAGSFLYVLTGLHGLHVLSAVIFVLVITIQTIRFKVHSKNILGIELCTTYWHFLDALWIYLFAFLTVFH
jgi:cytochrome c oxidase subunit III